jgi:hypothetical protein
MSTIFFQLLGIALAPLNRHPHHLRVVGILDQQTLVEPRGGIIFVADDQGQMADLFLLQGATQDLGTSDQLGLRSFECPELLETVL